MYDEKGRHCGSKRFGLCLAKRYYCAAGLVNYARRFCKIMQDDYVIRV